MNEILVTVTLIIQLKAGSEIGTASGFFYVSEGRLFMVTNQHAVTDAKTPPDMLRLRLHLDQNDLTKVGELDIPLQVSGKDVWFTHPVHKAADIVLVPLNADDLKKRFFFKAWSKEGLLPEDLVINPGDDVFIMGYPLSFHDFKHNLPILRNAMVASAYGLPFAGHQFFLTDANLHPGTSGSPVITKPKSNWVDKAGDTRMMRGAPYYLLGVHSGVIDPKLTQGTALGLGAAWYARLIEETAVSARSGG